MSLPFAFLAAAFITSATFSAADPLPRKIIPLKPPEQGFFAKRLDFRGVPIKAPAEVLDEALLAAHDRLGALLQFQPSVLAKLIEAGAELHIIGRHQVTTDLPEWGQDKGKSLPEYHGLTRDERTRGMGGLYASCGEENLLRLPDDRYAGRDICIHEFAHTIRNFGLTRSVRAQFDAQFSRSNARGLWRGAYASTNADEFFAELSMWYFGTHGDLGMAEPKPAPGPDGLRLYDPEAFMLFDALYQGHLESIEPSQPAPADVQKMFLDRPLEGSDMKTAFTPTSAKLPNSS